DPTHRQVVRLVEVSPTFDPLFSLPVQESEEEVEQRMPLPLLEVRWDAEDALPFPLCISSLGRPPECELVDDVSVARGNVLLVDHGRSVGEDLGTVAAEEGEPRCEGEGQPEEVVERAQPFRPLLNLAPLTFAQPIAAHLSALRLLGQDPHLALPQLRLTASR